MDVTDKPLTFTPSEHTHDHGSLSDLTSDDHTIYLDIARHDTTTRHGSSVVDHGQIGGLTDDDHTQYAFLAGRSGGQGIYGGTAANENLNLYSTTDADTDFVYSQDDLALMKGVRLDKFSYEKSFVVTFTNGVANQKVDIQFGGIDAYHGAIEVTLVSRNISSNGLGQLIKSYVCNLTSSDVRLQYTKYKFICGAIANDFAISDIVYDSTTSKFKITVAHGLTTSNTIGIDIKFLSNNWGTYLSQMFDVTTSAIYTTDTSVYATAVVSDHAGRCLGSTILSSITASTFTTQAETILLHVRCLGAGGGGGAAENAGAGECSIGAGGGGGGYAER